MGNKKIDGRQARRLANTETVARAMIALMRETGEVPSPEDVAERAGVSRRSVFRHFKDMDALSRAAIALQRAEVMERFQPFPEPEGDATERVHALVEHRAGLYELIMPLRRIAERRRHQSPVVDQDLANARKMLQAHIDTLFGDLLPEDGLQRGDLLHALEQASSWHAWRTLRDEQGCSVARAKRVVTRTLRALLGNV